MLIVSGTYGQFCNQLFRLGHHIANGLEYGYEVNCADFEYRHVFTNLTRHSLVSGLSVLTPWQRRIMQAGNRQFMRLPLRFWLQRQGFTVLDRALTFQESDQRFTEQAIYGRVMALHWGFRDFNAFNRHLNTLQTLFALPASVEAQAGQLVEQARTLGDVVAGIHIRRGDYAQWQGGRFYYTDAVYARLMTHVAGLFPGKSVSFLLCSNEPVDPSVFSNQPVVISRQDAMTDLASLGKCDWLLGPPSTFSLWASCMGRVPYYHLTQPDALPRLADFAISRG